MTSFLILNFLILFVLGTGFSTLLRPKGDITQQISLSGAMGFSLVSVLLTIFIQAGIRPSIWFWLVLAFLSIVCGAGFLVLTFRKHRPMDVSDLAMLSPRACKSIWLPPIVATGAVLIIGLATLSLGGSAFHMLRGNGTDSFNYATIAMALERLPLSVIQGTDAQTLIARNPSLGLAKSLLTTRWTTGALLGWCAGISGSAAVQITFAFGLLCLVLAVGPCFLLARLIGLNPWQAAGLTVAILTGFWAQVVLDMQALSHLHALPIALLWTFLVIEIQGQLWKSWMAKEGFLLLLATCALFLAYPEILPFLLLGLALHYIWMLVCRRARLIQVIIASLPLALGLALAFFISPSLLDFLGSQLHYGATGVNTWHRDYFSWLYQNPPAGLWGLNFIDLGQLGTDSSTALPWQVLMGSLGLILTFAAVVFLVQCVRDRGDFRARNLVAAFIIAGFLQVLALLIRQQWWAAGKAVSFFVPFLWLGAGLAVFTWPKQPKLHRQAAVAKLIRTVGIIWVASQIWMGIARIGIAATGSDYKGYMSHHGFYRQYDLNIAPILKALGKPASDSIALITGETWLGEYVSLSLGNYWPIRFANDITDRAGNSLFLKSGVYKCRYILVDRRMCLEPPDRQIPKPVAFTKDLLLLDIKAIADNMPILVAISNPNGIERTAEGIPFFWMGGASTIIWIASARQGTFFLYGDWRPGPSLPGGGNRTLEITNDEDGRPLTLTITPKTKDVQIHLQHGLNRFRFRIREQRSRMVLSNGDKRPLFFGLWNPCVKPFE
jgi:hypothetical protein